MEILGISDRKMRRWHWRMERGEYSQDYHMSLKAAECYWHFVDIVWIFLFFSLYLF